MRLLPVQSPWYHPCVPVINECTYLISHLHICYREVNLQSTSWHSPKGCPRCIFCEYIERIEGNTRFFSWPHTNARILNIKLDLYSFISYFWWMIGNAYNLMIMPGYGFWYNGMVLYFHIVLTIFRLKWKTGIAWNILKIAPRAKQVVLL